MMADKTIVSPAPASWSKSSIFGFPSRLFNPVAQSMFLIFREEVEIFQKSGQQAAGFI
jgi:hypothetical protein